MEELCGISWSRLATSLPPPKGRRRLRLADLFCGCGGLTLGAIEAARSRGRAAEVALAVDYDADAAAVFHRNFCGHGPPPLIRDVSAMFSGAGKAMTPEERRLRKSVGPVDLLVAGPPCQGHSDLNNRTRRQDPRNELYSCVVRAVRVLAPTALVVENVPPVVHDKGKVVPGSTEFLKELGYHVATTVVDASDIGLAQRRRRHVLIASRKSAFDLEAALSKHLTPSATPVSAYLSDLVDGASSADDLFRTASKMKPDNDKRVRWLFANEAFDLPNRLRPICHQNGHSYVSMYGRMRWDQPAQTITSGFGCMGQGRFVHPLRPRTLTPHEAARLQGFPDFFSFEDVKKRTSLQQIIGNAVPPKLSAVFVAGLIDQRCV